MSWSEEEQRISPQEMRTIAASVAALDDSETVTLGCLIHLTNTALLSVSNHIDTQPIQSAARSMVSLYLGHDQSRIPRVYAVAKAIRRTQSTFDYLQSIPL